MELILKLHTLKRKEMALLFVNHGFVVQSYNMGIMNMLRNQIWSKENVDLKYTLFQLLHHMYTAVKSGN
jgi:hypothetical protein